MFEFETQLHNGEVYNTENHGKVEVVDYRSSSEVVIKFLDYDILCMKRATHIRSGNLSVSNLVVGQRLQVGKYLIEVKDNERSSIRFNFIHHPLSEDQMLQVSHILNGGSLYHPHIDKYLGEGVYDLD